MTKEIYQIQIILKDSKPKIWRRILINSNILLVDFHRIIQTTMGWTNSHLHRFFDGINDYAPAEFEIQYSKNSRTIKLNKILKKGKENLLYEYDFGDGWIHDIILEKILSPDNQLQIPKCIAGKRSCPPEDCGGTWGYTELQEIILNPEHPEYDETLEWLGNKFDPKYFSLDEINKKLKKKDFGCIWL